MAWVNHVIAGIFEWGWPIGLKFGWTEAGLKPWPMALAIVSMAVSGAFLLLAQREIPVGTAYAVWTGIGAVGVFFFGDMVLGRACQSGPLYICRLYCRWHHRPQTCQFGPGQEPSPDRNGMMSAPGQKRTFG